MHDIVEKIKTTKNFEISNITPELIEKIVNGLTFFQKITQRILGYVFIDNLLIEGWKEKTPFYLFKCERHGYKLNYPHGHEMNLLCPECLKELVFNSK